MKPYYQNDFATIYHGDCREILPTLPKVDLVLTDPPYGVDFDTDYRRFTAGFNVERKAHKKVANDDKPFDPAQFIALAPVVILWGANCYPNHLTTGSFLVWDKRFSNGAAFLADAEVAWMNKGHGVYIYTETSQGFIRSEPIEHPTQKPIGLMVWCLGKAAKCQTILDPFMGSGTTLVAAKQLGRKSIGIELEEKYCEIAAKRLSQEYLPLNQPVEPKNEQPELV